MSTGKTGKYDAAEQPLRPDANYNEKSTPRSGCLELLHAGLIFTLWLIGLAGLILGSLFLKDIHAKGWKHLQPIGPLQNAAILVIVIGSAIMIAGPLGCHGLRVKNKAMILLFAGLMVCLVLLGIAACILAWYHRKGATLENQLRTLIGRVIQQYVTGQSNYQSKDDWSFNRNTLISMEYFLHCCGASGTVDYVSRVVQVPYSCYYNDKYNNMLVSQQGCVETFQNFIRKHSLILGLLCVVALIIQFILIMTSLIIAKKNRREGTLIRESPKPKIMSSTLEHSTV